MGMPGFLPLLLTQLGNFSKECFYAHPSWALISWGPAGPWSVEQGRKDFDVNCSNSYALCSMVLSFLLLEGFGNLESCDILSSSCTSLELDLYDFKSHLCASWNFTSNSLQKLLYFIFSWEQWAVEVPWCPRQLQQTPLENLCLRLWKEGFSIL